MTHGFNVNDDLVCEGIIGDGCGGGRLFIVKESTLIAYDPQTKSELILLENVSKAMKISKKMCIITIVCQNETILFDLSSLQKV